MTRTPSFHLPPTDPVDDPERSPPPPPRPDDEPPPLPEGDPPSKAARLHTG
ncbi:hypothetical protein [Paraburkholderia sacchari]|uniref:Uncharacterized protein n=1 Tax=Paraburkholderia sacchari TaxID=159450 RepID=A0A8T6Z7T1_9BURK|nr:hypothetical protein [Paraburkholderia sacchari]NLP60310.1 hypothetical protein [Paraburkholderia sacchari]